MFGENRIGIVIPALNEEDAIGEVLADLPMWLDRVIVVDNGSTDATAEIAANAGAEVVAERRRGYGAACLAGLRSLMLSEPSLRNVDGSSVAEVGDGFLGTGRERPEAPVTQETNARPDIVVFMDADRSDDPEDLPSVLSPLVRDEADLVIGSRVLGECEPGSLTPPQRFGNALSSFLLRMFWNIPCTDLGPFRAMRLEVLETLGMSDLDYGWTVEMQARAARMRLRITEVPVAYRRRVGTSKISGTIRGVVGAGTKILGTIAKEFLVDRAVANKRGKLILFSRLPIPGQAKTRMIPAIGAEAAADLQTSMTRHMLAVGNKLAGQGIDLEVRYTGGSRTEMAAEFGFAVDYREQGPGDLGEKLTRSFDQAFQEGARKVVCAGTDCPEISTDILHQAFLALKTHDVVLGPALDGGYYLVGTNVFAPALFQNITWGTESVFRETMDRAKALGLSVRLLPELSDVDLPEDLAVWERVTNDMHERQAGMISVIIPTLNAADVLPAAILSARQDANVEIIVADGGSQDETVEVAKAHGAKVVLSEQGRGIQLNAGAAAATGEHLLFLHADTILPFGYARFVRSVCAQPEHAAGAFRMAFDVTSFLLRLVETGTALRSRWLQVPYGDQGLFMNRAVFEELQGYSTRPQMEDYELVTRLRGLGTIAISSLPALTSAAKYQQHGVLRTVWRHQRMLVGHSPQTV